MKKVILILLCLFLGCGCSTNKASDAAIEYINKYKNHKEEVMISLKELIKNEDITEEQSNIYTLIMKKQYDDLTYKVIEEIYNGDKATVKLEISVYDYLKSKEDAKIYMEEHKEEFYLSDNTFNEIKYQNLQLKYMEEETKRIKYTLELETFYEKDKWLLEIPDYKIIQKIHGIYDYKKE